MHDTPRKHETAGAQKETTPRNQALTCSLVNNQVTLINHFLIIFSIEEGENGAHSDENVNPRLYIQIIYSVICFTLESQG